MAAVNRLEFDILNSCFEKDPSIIELRGYSEEEAALTRDSLMARGLISGNGISQAGLDALEPYRVRRVVFLAAGFGSRMVPVTINTPKPLVRVHGKRIIETLLDAVLDAGIDEIYIVRGYLGEQFELLKSRYPMIRLIENPEYDGTGTISSFYYAKDLLDNAYVLESDLVVSNPKVIHRYHFSSDFMGTLVGETDDWYLRTDENGIIKEVGVGGSGKNCYKLIGMSYWNTEDGERLKNDIREAYEAPEGKKLPMSFVPFRVYKHNYEVSVMPCKAGDVIEIDTFAELQAFDEIYKKH